MTKINIKNFLCGVVLACCSCGDAQKLPHNFRMDFVTQKQGVWVDVPSWVNKQDFGVIEELVDGNVQSFYDELGMLPNDKLLLVKISEKAGLCGIGNKSVAGFYQPFKNFDFVYVTWRLEDAQQGVLARYHYLPSLVHELAHLHIFHSGGDYLNEVFSSEISNAIMTARNANNNYFSGDLSRAIINGGGVCE